MIYIYTCKKEEILWVWNAHLSALKLTLSVLLGVMHGEEQREGGADRFFATATQTTVLNFTTKQLSNDRLTRGAQTTATQTQSSHICYADVIF